LSRIYKAVFKCHAGSILIEPSVHYQTDVGLGGDEPDPNDVATGIWNHLSAGFLENTPTDVGVDELVVTEQVLPPAIGVQGLHAIGLSGTLPAGGNKLPEGLVPLINIKTATASRSARGWTHLPSPQRSDYCNGNLWTSTYITLLGAFCADFIQSFNIGSVNPTGLNPIVYSRTRHQRDQDPWTFRVVSATPNAEPKWLRSRMTAP
jgi:hypothetical protein